MNGFSAAIAACLLLVGIAAQTGAAEPLRKPTHILPQPLRGALAQLAHDRKLQVLYLSDAVKDVATQGAEGNLSTDEALTQLLNHTGLMYRYIDQRAITIVPINSSDTDSKPAKALWEISYTSDNHASPDAASDDQSSLAAPSPAATSNETEPVKLEDIIVTAEKRVEDLQTTPLSITAFTPDTLRQMNASGLDDIGKDTPNMTFNQYGSSSVVAIRGVGQSDPIVTADPGVAIYVDGVYMPRLFGDDTDLLDVARIEVLRGPQGTLFGKNAIGGAINVITQTPGNDFHATFDVRGGSRGRHDEGAFVNLPIVQDKLAASIAVSLRNQDGYVNLPEQDKRAGDTNRQNVRTKLRWDVTEDLDVTLGAQYYRQREAGLAPQLVAVNSNAIFSGLYNAFVGSSSGVLYDGRWLAPKYTSYGTSPQFDDTDVHGVDLTLNYRVGEAALRSITAYRTIHNRSDSDEDGSPLPITSNPIDQSSRTFTEELQYTQRFLDRLDNVLGVFYLREHAQDSDKVLAVTGLYDALVAAGQTVTAIETDYTQYNARNQETDSYALYDQGTYHFTDAFSSTLGLRYTYEHKDDRLYVFYPDQNLVGLDKPISQGWSSVTPKLSFQYRITPADMVYISAAEGFKSGGINGRPSTDAAVVPYGPEKLWNYEAGVKTQWWEDRLRVNLTAFHMDYRDIQLQTFSGLNILTSNAGQARMNGLEAELAVKPVDFLMVTASAGYNDFKYTKLQASAATAGVTSNDKLPFTPLLTYNLSPLITLPIPGSRGELTFGVNYSYRSKQYLDAANTEGIAQAGYGLIGARAGWLSPTKQWEVYAYGDNLSDRYYRVFGVSALAALGWEAASYGPPREVGGGLHVNF